MIRRIDPWLVGLADVLQLAVFIYVLLVHSGLLLRVSRS
jgi:hypothetical protein